MTTIDPKLRRALAGISGILIAPFDAQDKLAPSRLKPIIDRAIGAGVHIGKFHGTESSTLTSHSSVHEGADQ